MKKNQCKDALDIYKKFLYRMTKLSEFLKVAEVTPDAPPWLAPLLAHTRVGGERQPDPPTPPLPTLKERLSGFDQLGCCIVMFRTRVCEVTGQLGSLVPSEMRLTAALNQLFVFWLFFCILSCEASKPGVPVWGLRS